MAKPSKKIAVETPAVPVVAEVELAQLVADRKAVKDLQASVTATKKRLDMAEASIIARLRSGAKVEGKYACIVRMVKGRIAISWKDTCQKIAIKAGFDFLVVEREAREAKEAEMVEEPVLEIGEAIEQYVATK